MENFIGVSIVFGKRRNPLMFISYLIRLVNKTPYSHCGVLVTKSDGSFVYESTMPKSKKTPYKDWLKTYKLVDVVPVKVEKDPTDFLTMLLGISYSYEQLFIIGLQLVFYPVFKYFKPQAINGLKALVCAEYAALFLQEFTAARFFENDFVTLSDVNKAARGLK